MIHYIFDVDGTLTPSRQRIEPAFESWFTDFVDRNPVYLVTGSDYPKTLEQLGDTICAKVKKIYNCCGNEIWQNGQNIYRSDWQLGQDQLLWLEAQLEKSPYDTKTGRHVELRSGMVNFSVVGRNADLQERNRYFTWDKICSERARIAKELMKQFPYLAAVVGGETGIDIFPAGKDKSQILTDFQNQQLYFFGDRIDPDGNDYTIAASIEKQGGTAYPVNGYHDTWKILKQLDK